ncbi:NUDIX hydrolase [Kitasatospora sp. DSM 101779]|uniref:NUDIX hydrolase n=1 Tax=Kitasatospora sp. DSM 101779 TaxID=2853165 RepID=UPI0021DA8182|nr:NUDIX hydrolase [Kitasatospora sp. DSM 101779]MCU7823427.1 NUDIX hydrolase [Kitasatospora sp. DSM 101779]
MGDRLTAAQHRAANPFRVRLAGRSRRGGAPALRAAVPGYGPTVLAAGGVLWVPGGPKKDGRGLKKPRIAVIHRPKYDDWSLPKGKLEPGEGWQAAALRELREETGMHCVLGQELPAQHYLVDGRPKEVRYWAAVPTGGSFTPGREVDRLEWLPPKKAKARLTHVRDRALVDALLTLLGGARA